MGTACVKTPLGQNFLYYENGIQLSILAHTVVALFKGHFVLTHVFWALPTEQCVHNIPVFIAP